MSFSFNPSRHSMNIILSHQKLWSFKRIRSLYNYYISENSIFLKRHKEVGCYLLKTKKQSAGALEKVYC